MGLLDATPQDYYEGNDHGNYQFTSLNDVINQFIVAYVGEDKIISKVKRVDVAFHAQRAMQELSFDTFKSVKAQEITLPPSLQMTLPQDYVNYTKVSWVDSAGIKHLLYPTSKTSNPTPLFQNSDGEYHIDAIGAVTSGSDQMVLSDQHDNILVGMHISGDWGGVEGNIVKAIDVSGGITTITMDNTSSATLTSGLPLKFTNSDGSLILENEGQVFASGLTLLPGTNFFALVSATDIENIKEGMLVSSEHFPVGTIVNSVSIISGKVFTSNNAVTGGIALDVAFTSPINNSTTWSNYKSGTPSENNDDYEDDTYWPLSGSRFGLDPQHAQANGSFYIDNQSGKIHFSSNISGKTVILDYISDSLGTDGEMQVHKFAEEAMYKWIAHAILSTRANVQEYIINRFKKERFAAIRTAKLRLSNIKLEEITQILRGKSKQIKH